jgi:hypothetical protein
MVGSLLLHKTDHPLLGSALIGSAWLFGVLFAACFAIRFALLIAAMPAALKAWQGRQQ